MKVTEGGTCGGGGGQQNNNKKPQQQKQQTSHRRNSVPSTRKETLTTMQQRLQQAAIQQQQAQFPFEGKTFYLDLRIDPTQRQPMAAGIIALKGTIEEFLTPEVKYVITDKPDKDWPKRSDCSSSQERTDGVSEKPMTSFTIIQQTIYRSNNPFISAMSTRAASAAGKATTDVLELAIRRNPPIKLVQAKKMIDFLREQGVLPGHLGNKRGTDGEAETSPPSKMKSIKAIPLSGPFIKLEDRLDQNQKYRPCCKVFQSWPELLLDSPPAGMGCPFRQTNVSPAAAARVEEVKAASRNRQEQHQQRQNLSNVTTTTSTTTTVTVTNGLAPAKVVFLPFSRLTPDDTNALTSTTTTTAKVTVITTTPTATLEGGSKMIPLLSTNAPSGTRFTAGMGGDKIGGTGTIGLGTGNLLSNQSMTTTPRIVMTTNLPGIQRRLSMTIGEGGDAVDATAIKNQLIAQAKKSVTVNAAKKKQTGFCEVCAVEYDNVNEVRSLNLRLTSR